MFRLFLDVTRVYLNGTVIICKQIVISGASEKIIDSKVQPAQHGTVQRTDCQCDHHTKAKQNIITSQQPEQHQQQEEWNADDKGDPIRMRFAEEQLHGGVQDVAAIQRVDRQ